MGNRLDLYSKFPSGMQEYLQLYGWHFSKKMYEWAISTFKRINPITLKPEPIDLYTKESLDEAIKKHGIVLKNCNSYDYCYLANKAKIILFKSSIDDEMHLLKYVRDVLDNQNSYPELPFTQFYADCIGKGVPIIWEDML